MDRQKNQKLDRQAKNIRIQYHQTSFATNTKGASPGGKEKAVTRSRITNGKAHWSRQTYSEGRKSSATNMVSKSATVRRAQMKDIGNAPKKTITGQYH